MRHRIIFLDERTTDSHTWVSSNHMYGLCNAYVDFLTVAMHLNIRHIGTFPKDQ